MVPHLLVSTNKTVVTLVFCLSTDVSMGNIKLLHFTTGVLKGRFRKPSFMDLMRL